MIMRRANIIASVFIILGVITLVFGGQQTENKADQTLHGSGRVNGSTLGMEFELPLGAYPGRGISVPITLSYSSKLWRFESYSSQPAVNNPDLCIAGTVPIFAENTASGWTTSLATPYIEMTNNLFDSEGHPLGESCAGIGGGNNYNGFIKRLTVHLPSGETHELRVNDTPVTYPASDPPPSRDGIYYAVDSSNLKYIQDSAAGTYKLLMPDGSFYIFDSATTGLSLSTIRKANKFSDRNGNYTTYNAPNTTYPNGYWTDTMGRTISVPFGLHAPTSTGVQTYEMPGLGGNTVVTYKFNWKQLSDTLPAGQTTKFAADYPSLVGAKRTGTDCCLFSSAPSDGYLLFDGSGTNKFNPIVLAEIELPTGQKYIFDYNDHGEIINVKYPTGGEEKFVYEKVTSVSELAEPHDQANRGVTTRKVYPTAGASNYYQWTYSTTGAPAPNYGLEITTTNPDNTKSIRRLFQSYLGSGTWGYDNDLAGMPYEEIGKNSAGQMLSRKMTYRTKTTLAGQADWHPRVDHEESYIYDTGGTGIYALTTFEYEGDLTQRETPVLMKKSSQYAFVPVGSSSPSTPIRSSETTFVLNDTNVLQAARDAYKAQNMVGLASASVIRDSNNYIVSRGEMLYDEAAYSIISPTDTPTNWQDPSNGYRGNPTTSRVWDSTKGQSTDSSAYIATHAQFDKFGNQRKVWDALGNLTETDYTSPSGKDYKFAFPTKVTSAVPDPTPSQNYDGLAHGSDTAFITTGTYDATTGLPLTATDANNVETRIHYDSATLRPLDTKTFYDGNQVGGMSETVYHDETNNYWVKSRTLIDTNKWVESISHFDGLGRAYKSEQVNSQGNIIVEKEFDAQGREKRVTNPYRTGETVYWTTNTYDEASRIKEVTLPDGAKIKTDYGVSTATGLIGVTKQITDQAGKKRKGISDALGRMIRVIEDPSGQNLPTDYVFDTLGNLRKTTQGEQNRYFTFDSLGRLLRAKQPEQEVNTALALPVADSITGQNQWSVGYEYNENGNITKTTNADNVSVTAIYDRQNRIIKRDYSDSTPDVGFFYDGRGLGSIPAHSNGKTTKVTSSVSENRYTSFDNLGRPLTSEQRTPFDDTETIANATPKTFTYQYNLTSMVSETYPSGQILSYEFNVDGELSRVAGQTSAGSKTYANSFNYNSAGAITSMRLGNGKWETAGYNDRLQVMQMGLGNSAVDTSLLKLEFGYGDNTQNNGSLRSQKISFSGLANPFEQTYGYDDLNRLLSAEEKVNNSTTWKQTFQYDRYGNRQFDAANTNTLSGSAPSKVTNPQINTSDNRLKKDQDNDSINDYDFDKDGNVTLDATNQRFVYDAENHLKQFFKGTNSTSTPDGIYYYNGDGKRVKKISSTEITVFVYDGGGQLAEEYSTATTSSPATSYLTTDHLGSTRIITDGLGAVVARKDFSAFGDETAATGQRTTALGYKAENIRQDYTGYQKDDESGLEYAQARYYNSAHGRFTSIDPLTASANMKDPQTFNRYSYALNSPYKFTDPLGLISSATGANGGARGERGYSRDLPDFLSRNMVDASGYRATDEPDNSPIVANTSGLSHSSNVSGSSAEGEPGTTETASDSLFPVPWWFDILFGNHNGQDETLAGYPHQCSINMSRALILSGISMKNYDGGNYFDFPGHPGERLARSAKQLGLWLSTHAVEFFGDDVVSNIGDTNSNWSFNVSKDGQSASITGATSKFWDEIQGKRGIIIALDSWRYQDDNGKWHLGDHIDLWDGSRFARAEFGEGKNLVTHAKRFMFIELRGPNTKTGGDGVSW
jgi:RHS repeat-associated protein